MVSTIFSCKPTRYLNENEYILKKVTIESDNKKIDTKELLKYNKQAPLRKTFSLFAFHARIYNIPNPKKDKKRFAKKQKKLDSINAKIFKKHDIKTGEINEKKIHYFQKYEKNLKRGDTIAAEVYYNNYLEYETKFRERKENITYRKDEMEKKDIFTWYEWIRSIGEKPPIYDTLMSKKSAEQFKLYLRNKGYYDAEVTYELVPKGKKLKRKKRVKLVYHITANEPIIIYDVVYKIKDKEIETLINQNKEELLIASGSLLDVAMLQDKRSKIASYLKKNGYYYFSKDYIQYSIDTIGRGEKAKLTVNIKQFTNKHGVTSNHKKFKFNNIYIFSDYNPNEALEFVGSYYDDTDTIIETFDGEDYYFILKNHLVIKPKAVVNELYIHQDSVYNYSNVKNTYNHLSKFRIYKLTNIQFTEVDTINNLLDCNIQLSPTNNISSTYEIVGTHSSGNVGAEANMRQSHKNIFRGGEIFEMKLRVALESQNILTRNDSTGFGFNTQEYGIEMKITFPRLLTPFKYEKFIRKNNPKTIMTTSFSYQDRPEYEKLKAGFNLDYYWKNNKYTSHVFTPIRFSSIRVRNMSDLFKEYITRTYISDSYEDHFITGTNYSIVFSNQEKHKTDYIYFKLNTSLAGNSAVGLMSVIGIDTIEGSYVVPYFNTLIAQFVKTDIDFRYYHDFSHGQLVASRIFIGAGLPYGNMKLLPFGEKYISGGTNSIRAWQVRSLGPGSYVRQADVNFPNQSADIKLEANIEYRFDLFWMLEGAFFIDAGNIWAINKYDNRKGALFQFDTFYNEIAVGTGFGVRLDISFFVLRLDIGLKVNDPSSPEDMRFIPTSRSYYFQDMAFNFGIGYPF